MKQILVVDDAPGLVKGLKHSLEREGFQVATAADGRVALEQIRSCQFDAVILDLMLPEVDGLTVCREVRRYSNVPIIMLTAKSDDLDKILGLEMGADDYITKPFNTKELIARLRALFRRIDALRGPGELETLQVGGVTIHRQSHRVEVDGRSVVLTPREFALLETLAAHPRAIYSRQQLLDLVWGYDFLGSDRTVDVMLALTRLESHTRHQHEADEQVELTALVATTLNELKPLAQTRGIALTMESGDPVWASGESWLVKTVLINLVENAIKFSPLRGSVKILVRNEGEKVHVAVRDSGPGIAPEHLPHLFERFYRVDKSRARTTGGVGLGLAIAAEAAALLNGRIAVESKPGFGSQFTLILPAAKPAADD